MAAYSGVNLNVLNIGTRSKVNLGMLLETGAAGAKVFNKKLGIVNAICPVVSKSGRIKDVNQLSLGSADARLHIKDHDGWHWGGIATFKQAAVKRILFQPLGGNNGTIGSKVREGSVGQSLSVVRKKSLPKTVSILEFGIKGTRDRVEQGIELPLFQFGSNNESPVINNLAVNPSILHKGTSILSGTITDPKNNTMQYRVIVNEDHEIVPWTDFMKSPINLNVPIPSSSENVGDNKITLQVFNGKEYATCSVSVKITDNLPSISGTLQDRLLTVTIGDADNDAVKYRILMNGVVVQDWSDFKQQPFTFTYIVPKKSILAGQPNIITIQGMDDLGQIQSWAATFAGKKSGYAFIL